MGWIPSPLSWLAVTLELRLFFFITNKGKGLKDIHCITQNASLFFIFEENVPIFTRTLISGLTLMGFGFSEGGSNGN